MLLGATVAAVCVSFVRPGLAPAIALCDARGFPRALIALPGGILTHAFTHSVHQTRVDESFRVSAGTLELFETRFDTYGVGIPTDAGDGFRDEDGRFVVLMTRRFDTLPVRVSHLPGDGLLVGGKLREFTEWFKAQDLVVIRPVLLPDCMKSFATEARSRGVGK